jgi:putative DNA primase/helicase
MPDYDGLLERALAQGVASGFSEDVLAQVFVATHGDVLRFDHTRQKWREWDGYIWREDTRQRAFEYARRVCREQVRAAKFHKSSVASGVERFASADPLVACDHSHWDADPMLLGTPGGTVNLRTGELMAPDAEHMITRSTSVAPASGEPKMWLSFLEEATGRDAALIAYLQRAMGYCLTGLTHEHALFFVHGPGGNGKGVFLNTVRVIMGTYAEMAMMDTFIASRNDRHSTDLATLAGARLVTASETQQGRSWDESRIKQMTGGDPITARFMRCDPFTYQPPFKIVIIGNHEPTLRNVDEAMRRRFNIIRFWHKPVSVDRLLEQKLKAEHSQILQWMIEGCVAWQRSGLQPPDAVKQATASYFEDQDLIGRWINECCEADSTHFSAAGQLYESYQRFVRHAGERELSQKALGMALRLRPGICEHKTGGVRGYVGLRLSDHSVARAADQGRHTDDSADWRGAAQAMNGSHWTLLSEERLTRASEGVPRKTRHLRPARPGT